MKFILLAAFGIAFATNSVPAAAQSEPPRKAVTYKDLNLSTKEGANALDRRVKRAIRSVCGDAGREPWARIHQRSCVQRATVDADKQVAKVIEDARVRAGKDGMFPKR